MTLQHTPTPLDRDEFEALEIIVAKHFGPAETAFTVRAVNCHEEMVKALKDVLFVLKGQAQAGNYFDSSERDISLEGVVEQAIAKAEGK